MNEKLTEERYLDQHVFYGLKNLNTGFDAPAIKYFNAADFHTVLKRCEKLGVVIMGIEPFKDGFYFDAAFPEEFDHAGIKWYYIAFEKFESLDMELQYAASYCVPWISALF